MCVTVSAPAKCDSNLFQCIPQFFTFAVLPIFKPQQQSTMKREDPKPVIR